jgi:hypothetical protein
MIVIEVVEAMAFFWAGYFLGSFFNRKPPVIKQVIDEKLIDQLNSDIQLETITYHADKRGMVLMPKGFEDIRRGKSKRLP